MQLEELINWLCLVRHCYNLDLMEEIKGLKMRQLKIPYLNFS